MRILLLNDDLPSDTLGGSGRIVVETARELSKRGHDVTILTAANAPPGNQKLEGIHIRTIPKLPVRWAHYRSVFSRRRAQEVLQVIREVKPDVIHAHGIAWQIGYRWIKSVQGIPIFSTAHGMMIIAYGKVLGTERFPLYYDLKRARWTYNPFRNRLIKKYLSVARKILCVSDALRLYLQSRGLRNLSTLHNGIDSNFWKANGTQEEARRKLGLPLQVPLFLIAGRLGYDKGVNLLLDIWPALLGDPHLVLAGTVAGLPKISEPVFSVFENQTPEQMRTIYEAIDVNLVPSLCFDCFPTTSLEAMSCSRPVIVGDRGGGKEAVVEGKTGFVIHPWNINEVQEKIQWCIDHRQDLSIMGLAARAHIEAHFPLEKHVDALLRLYTAATP